MLVTGPAGAGKSTTLACMIDRLNHERSGHIITMEDPIEFVHRHDKCIVTQREIPTDVATYSEALRSAMRESPDIVLLGEMRDYDTIGTAVTAAEMAQLIFSTLHTTGGANTIDRILDAFPANQQRQIRMQLSMVLQAVVSQQLVPARVVRVEKGPRLPRDHAPRGQRRLHRLRGEGRLRRRDPVRHGYFLRRLYLHAARRGEGP